MKLRKLLPAIVAAVLLVATPALAVIQTGDYRITTWGGEEGDLQDYVHLTTGPYNFPSVRISDGAKIMQSFDPSAVATVRSVALTSSSLTVTGSPITSSGTATIEIPNVGTAGTYSSVTTDAKGRVTSGTNRSQSSASRSLDTCFQVSSTRDAFVNYSIDIATTATLASGQVGTIYLETFSNSGCTTGTQEVSRFVNGNTQTLGLTVTLVQNVTGTLTGYVPSGSYVKLRTQNNTGTPTFTYRSGQEVQL